MGRVKVGRTVRQVLRERVQQRRHGNQAGDARGGQRARQRACRAASPQAVHSGDALERRGAHARGPPAAWMHASRQQVARVGPHAPAAQCGSVLDMRTLSGATLRA